MPKRKSLSQTRGGRGASVPALCNSVLDVPRPIVRDDFLSKSECADILRELKFTLWQPSLSYQRHAEGFYGNVLNPRFRISETAFADLFTEELGVTLNEIERRLRRVVAFEASHLETWQATLYGRNGFVDYHLDAGYWDGHPAGDRILTFLIYLTTPAVGGSTHFRALDVDVTARAGRLLVWGNLFPDGRCDHRMVHAGLPLIRGQKATLVTWERQKPYRHH